MNIIAEIGSNWKDWEQICRMMESLKDIGIHLIKFQLFNKDQVKDLPEYIPKIITEKWAHQFFLEGKDLGVDVFFSVCYPEAIPMCERIGVKYYKIRYFDKDNQEIIQKVVDTGKPWFRSCDVPFIANTKVINLFCVPKYPAPIKDYWSWSGFIGISDHTPDLELYKQIGHLVKYWEMHVKEDDNCLESEWSKKIGDLKSVLV